MEIAVPDLHLRSMAVTHHQRLAQEAREQGRTAPSECEYGDGWLRRWKVRYRVGIRRTTTKKPQGSATDEQVHAYRLYLNNYFAWLLTRRNGKPLNDVCNMDEVGIASEFLVPERCECGFGVC